MPFYFLLSALWVAVDQVVKYLVRTYIPLYASVPFLPGMDLTYVQNTGAAFSLLSEHTWVLTLLSAVVSVGLVVAMAKRILPHWSGMLSLALLLGGAVGNLIDRVLNGVVVDYINVLFMHFAIFNFADICVCVGVGLLMLVVLLDSFKKEETAKQKADDDGAA